MTQTPRRPTIRLPRPGPETVTATPYNAETALAAIGEPLTDPGAFFVRNHFDAPRMDPRDWRLRIDGAVLRPFTLTYSELRALPSHALEVVLECAGNGRSLMKPTPPGVPWGLRAAGCTRFVGVTLRTVLGRAGVLSMAREVVFAGADGFERSLTVRQATRPDVLLATHMGDGPLTRQHGAPVRLVVPGWYGVASVKWLVGVTAVTEPFRGHFQTSYVYRYPGVPGDVPTRRMRVRALITAPRDGAVLPRGPVTVAGHAWSGEAPIERVEVSLDGGATWSPAQLRPAPGWTDWSITMVATAVGVVRAVARATDRRGNTQPWTAPWNAFGYGNNAIGAVEFTIGRGARR
ncbi:sulfite oxidase [Rhodococcus daqingensis]|uniref:Sulfite oxidase n=1 Tax=Rhodococcus daqingensis TaxID=2479363 RepID=A0ABW2RTQ0_9NOCA